MSDNITLNAGSGGATIATDDIGNLHYPINKLAFGALNSATLVSGSDPLPVTVTAVPANSALAAGTNLIGKVSIDQVTPNANEVVVLASAGIGSLTESAPATDTASSGLNGRLQRVAQRLTSLISQLPSTLGIKTAANSLSVAPASDATFVLGAGSALAGKFGIDQTTDGTTNAVSIKSTAAKTNISVAAYVSNKVIKASAGTLYRITGYNSSASAQFIQLHDSATLPVDTAVPVLVQKVAAGSNFTIEFGSIGRAFTTGIVVANSSTGPTLTIGSADLWIDAQYS